MGTTTPKPGPRWAIQVVFPSGGVGYLRHGAKPGDGAIVQFRTRKLADINREFVEAGLTRGETVSVVRYAQSMEE